MNINHKIQIPIINEETNYWLIKTANGKFYYPYLKENRITLHNISFNDEPLNNKKSQQVKIFTDTMKINDIVLIPSHLKKTICIGIVTSDCQPSGQPFFRSVRWKKEISFSELDAKCHQYFYSHETIIQLNDVAPYLVRLIYPIYIKNEKYHFSLKINQKSNILFKSLYGLYRLFLDDQKDDHLEIKINLQSPGIIEFISKSIDVILIIIKVIQLIHGILHDENKIHEHKELMDKYYHYEIDKLEIDLPEINDELEEK